MSAPCTKRFLYKNTHTHTHTHTHGNHLLSSHVVGDGRIFTLLLLVSCSNPKKEEELGGTDIRYLTIRPATADDRWEVNEEGGEVRAQQTQHPNDSEITFRCAWCHLKEHITHTLKASNQPHHDKRWLCFALTRWGQPCMLVIFIPGIYSYQASRANHPGGARLSATMSWQRRAWDGLWMTDGQQKGKTGSKSEKKTAQRKKHTNRLRFNGGSGQNYSRRRQHYDWSYSNRL